MFPRNEAELLQLVGDSLRILARKEFAQDLLGISVSSHKRHEKEDADFPKLVARTANRVGVIEMHGRAYVLLRFAKRLELEGKPVGWTIRLLRSIIHGEALQDPPEEADAA